MSETVSLYLTSNGEQLIGDVTQTSLGREESIECLSFMSSVRTAREKGSGMATGRRTHEPIAITKRIDKSSPLIARSLCANEVIEATFKFFRPSPAGDGTTEQFFTISVGEGRIASYTHVSSSAIDPASANEPPIETVTFVFGKISWAYTPTGAEAEDSWKENA